jgi:hypothetical protein
MAYTIKYLGSQLETSADNTVTLSNCTVADNDALVVFAGCLDAPGAPTVEFGGVSIVQDDWRIAPVSRLSGGVWHKNTVWNGRTADITASFGSSIVAAGSFVVGKSYKITTVGTTDFTLIGATENTVGIIFTATGVGTGTGEARTQLQRRYIIAYAVTNGGRKDLVKRNVQDTATDVPNTLLSAELGANNELMMAYHLSNGPITDVAGTPEAGLTTLHRVGTSVGTNDFTIHTTTKEVVPIDQIRSRLTGATARQWLSCLIAVRPIIQYPALDQEGSEVFIGDTVSYQGVNSTISNIIYKQGIPLAVLVLADGRQIPSYYGDLIE